MPMFTVRFPYAFGRRAMATATLAGLVVLSLAPPITLALESSSRILLKPEQEAALELKTEALKRAQRGEGPQLPALVVLPNVDVRVVAAPTSGLVQAMLVTVNQTVAANQPLARIQSPAAMTLQKEYLQTLYQVRLATETLTRDESLYREGIIALSRLQSSRANALQAQAEANERRKSLLLMSLPESAVQALETKGELKPEIDLLSPLDGVVLEQFATPGQRIDALTPLYRVGRLAGLMLEIQVPAVQAANIEPGLPVRIPSVQGAGRIVTVGRNVNPDNQTVVAIAAVTDQGEHLSPNQFVHVVMDMTPTEPDTWLVPNASLVRTGGEAYIFVWSAQGYIPTHVAVLQESVTQTLVRGPMQAGDRVIVKGAAALKAIWLQTAGNG